MCSCVTCGSRDTVDETWQQPLDFTAWNKKQPVATASTQLNLLRVVIL